MTYSQEGASLKSHKLNGDHTKQLKYEVARIDLPTFSTSFTEDFHWRERENKTRRLLTCLKKIEIVTPMTYCQNQIRQTKSVNDRQATFQIAPKGFC